MWLAAVISLFGSVDGKVVTCSPDLTQNMNNRWAYCTKMAFKKDNFAHVKSSVEFVEKDGPNASRAVSLQLFVFKEEAWDKILQNSGLAEGRVTCEKMGHSAAYRDFLYFNNDQYMYSEFQRYIEFKS